MRRIMFAGSMIASLITVAIQQAEIMRMFRHSEPLDTKRPKRRRTGKTYPHSSARQEARYARQLAAGQISFISHGPLA
jgi:hypothetical protein